MIPIKVSDDESMTFTSIDFETANPRRGSACQIGLVRVEKGRIVGIFESLLRPEPFDFHNQNILIHGIEPSDCLESPSLDTVVKVKRDWLEGQILVAHNMIFDKSVLEHSLIKESINASRYMCSLELSKSHLPGLKSYKLSRLVYELTGKLGEMHSAKDDAMMVCTVMNHIFLHSGIPFSDLRITQARIENPVVKNLSDSLKGEVFTFTGELFSMSRMDAFSLVTSHSGIINKGLTKKTTILVIGTGLKNKSGKLQKAERYGTKVISEQDFLNLNLPPNPTPTT